MLVDAHLRRIADADRGDPIVPFRRDVPREAHFPGEARTEAGPAVIKADLAAELAKEVELAPGPRELSLGHGNPGPDVGLLALVSGDVVLQAGDLALEGHDARHLRV